MTFIRPHARASGLAKAATLGTVGHVERVRESRPSCTGQFGSERVQAPDAARANMTFAPEACESRAMPAPMPLDAPVMRTTLSMGIIWSSAGTCEVLAPNMG